MFAFHHQSLKRSATWLYRKMKVRVEIRFKIQIWSREVQPSIRDSKGPKNRHRPLERWSKCRAGNRTQVPAAGIMVDYYNEDVTVTVLNFGDDVGGVADVTVRTEDSPQRDGI